MRKSQISLLGALTLAACASGGSTSSSSAPAPAVAQQSAAPADSAAPAASRNKNRNVITAEQLASPQVRDGDVYTAILKLQPQYFKAQGAVNFGSSGYGVIVTFDSEQSFYATDVLKTTQVSEIKEVRYMSPSEAAQLYGVKTEKAAVIHLKRR